MRVLVCGGRKYNDAERLSEVLHRLHDKAGIDIIIQGGAKGADHWAKRMLEEGKPDVVVAFPGGRGHSQYDEIGAQCGC